MSRPMTIELPDEVATSAEAEGLLSPDIIAGLLREELRRRAGQRLSETMKLAHAANDVPLSDDEIQQLVDEVRAERRAERARRT